MFVTEPVTLAAVPEGAKVRISNVPVYLAGRDDTQSMLGALNAVRSANGTVSLDLRPLAVGRGRYRVEIALKSGKHAKKVKRSYTVGRTGALPRISASLSKATREVHDHADRAQAGRQALAQARRHAPRARQVTLKAARRLPMNRASR